MRAINGTIHPRRRKKIMKAASGFRGGRSRLYRTAKQAVMKAGVHTFASRRQKKRQMRSLWIVRINAAARANGMSYSSLINTLNKSGTAINRKMLSEMALNEPESFNKLVKSIAR